MFLEGDRKSGLRRFIDRVKMLADEQSHRMDRLVSVHVDENVLAEAFTQACNSIEFHKIPIERASHYKELAHLAYWIAELKPVSLLPPMKPATLVELLGPTSGARLLDAVAGLPDEDPSFRRRSRAYKKYARYPISEAIAVEFIAYFAEVEAQLKISGERRDEVRAELTRRHTRFRAIFFGRVAENMILALRFHTFASRSFSTLVESVFAFEDVEDDGIDRVAAEPDPRQVRGRRPA